MGGTRGWLETRGATSAWRFALAIACDVWFLVCVLAAAALDCAGETAHWTREHTYARRYS